MGQEERHRALLVLLRSGLWERPIDDASLFPLSDDGWNGVLSLARQQTVVGLVYNALQYLPDEYLPAENILFRLVAEASGIEQRNRKMNRALKELCSLFRAQGIVTVLQKGQGIAQLYATPLLRACGDIDLYFPDPAQRAKAEQLLKGMGIKIEEKADDSAFYLWHELEVEHHSLLLDLQNPLKKHYLCKLEGEKGFTETVVGDGDTDKVTVPSPLLNLLLLNTHILKHTMGWGIGLRQLCDMARASYALQDCVEAEELKRVYRKVGIGKWSRLLYAFLVKELGLPVACVPYREGLSKADTLADIIWRGGNFGQYLEGRNDAAQGVWKRKLHTSLSFIRQGGFSLRYAPAEAFWTFTNLLWGQFK